MIYFDHAALTPVVAAAREAMDRAVRESWGNPSSVHAAGRRARSVLEQARIALAAYLRCSPPELRWTAGGSEALRLALDFALSRTEGSIVCTRLDHPSLRQLVEAAEQAGREVRWLPLVHAAVDMDQAATALDGAAVVALSALNHELGTALPLPQLMDLAPAAWWVIDAVQAAAWIDLQALFRPRVFVAIASQKLGGPPGAGALRLPHELSFARSGQEQFPEVSGTPPWLAAVGLGAACTDRQARLDDELPRLRTLARRLLDGMRRIRPDLGHNADASWVGPILNVSLPEVAAPALETALDLRGVCIARTSACQQSSVLASPVVAAAWPDEPWRARNATRWSLGLQTSEADIDEALGSFAESVVDLGR